MITLFILNTPGRGNYERAVNSWGDLVVRVHETETRSIDLNKVFTPVYAYMYEDEYLDEPLLNMLTMVMANPQWQALVLYRELEDGRLLKSPRIFRGLFPLDDSLCPVSYVSDRLAYFNVPEGRIRG
jgi:hypothetical protein